MLNFFQKKILFCINILSKLTNTLLTDRGFIWKPVLHRLVPVILYSQNLRTTALFLGAINSNGKHINHMNISALSQYKTHHLKLISKKHLTDVQYVFVKRSIWWNKRRVSPTVQLKHLARCGSTTFFKVIQVNKRIKVVSRFA